MSLKRVMAVAKRADGKLVIHSAIAMTEDRMRELEGLGEPAYLIVPSRAHRLDAPAADDAVRLEMLHGFKQQEGVMIVKSPDGTTLVFNDAVFNMDRKRDPLGFLFTSRSRGLRGDEGPRSHDGRAREGRARPGRRRCTAAGGGAALNGIHWRARKSGSPANTSLQALLTQR